MLHCRYLISSCRPETKYHITSSSPRGHRPRECWQHSSTGVYGSRSKGACNVGVCAGTGGRSNCECRSAAVRCNQQVHSSAVRCSQVQSAGAVSRCRASAVSSCSQQVQSGAVRCSQVHAAHRPLYLTAAHRPLYLQTAAGDCTLLSADCRVAWRVVLSIV